MEEMLILVRPVETWIRFDNDSAETVHLPCEANTCWVEPGAVADLLGLKVLEDDWQRAEADWQLLFCKPAWRKSQIFLLELGACLNVATLESAGLTSRSSEGLELPTRISTFPTAPA